MRKLQGLLLIALFATPLIYQPTFYQVLKLRTFDRFIETPDRSGYFAILNITEEDMAISSLQKRLDTGHLCWLCLSMTTGSTQILSAQ